MGSLRIAVIVVTLAARSVFALDMRPETLADWIAYVEAARKQADARLESGATFLWADDDATRRDRVLRGNIVAAPFEIAEVRHIRRGMVHHWIGVIFIPGAKIADVLGVVRDYDHYAEIYRPATQEAKLLTREEGSDTYSAVLRQKALMVTATAYGEYASQYESHGEDRWTGAGYSTSIHEIHDYGKPGELRMKADDGSGFLWRAWSFSRYLERDGGVWLELEALVLSRDIPAVWRWLVSPVVQGLARDTMQVSLRETRDEVQRRMRTATAKP